MKNPAALQLTLVPRALSLLPHSTTKQSSFCARYKNNPRNSQTSNGKHHSPAINHIYLPALPNCSKMSSKDIVAPHAPIVSSPLNPSPPPQRPLPFLPKFTQKRRKSKSKSTLYRLQRVRGEMAWRRTRLLEDLQALGELREEIDDETGGWVARVLSQPQGNMKKAGIADDQQAIPSLDSDEGSGADKEWNGGVLPANVMGSHDGRENNIAIRDLKKARHQDIQGIEGHGDSDEGGTNLECLVAIRFLSLFANTNRANNQSTNMPESTDPRDPGNTELKQRPVLRRNGSPIHIPELWLTTRPPSPPPGFSHLAGGNNGTATGFHKWPPLTRGGSPIHIPELWECPRANTTPPGFSQSAKDLNGMTSPASLPLPLCPRVGANQTGCQGRRRAAACERRGTILFPLPLSTDLSLRVRGRRRSIGSVQQYYDDECISATVWRPGKVRWTRQSARSRKNRGG